VNKFNRKLFLISTLIVFLLVIVIFFAEWFVDDQYRNHLSWKIIQGLTYIIRFPTHTLFWNFLTRKDNLLYYFGSLLINCIFYGIVVERIFSLLRRKANIPRVPTDI